MSQRESSLDGEMEAESTGISSMAGKQDMEATENPLEPLIESLRQQIEEQDPVFLIGVIVALAVVIITCGEQRS